MKNVLVIDNGSKHTDKIIDFFEGWSVARVSYDDPVIHETADDTLVVLSGGDKKAIVSNLDDYRSELDFIREFGGSIIGICLGFEAIVHAHGEWLTRMDNRSEGLQDVTLISNKSRINLPGMMKVYESHRWRLGELGKDSLFEAVAMSSDGVEIVKHIERPVYGTQFHPEVRRGNDDGARVFRALVDHAVLSQKHKHDIITKYGAQT